MYYYLHQPDISSIPVLHKLLYFQGFLHICLYKKNPHRTDFSILQGLCFLTISFFHRLKPLPFCINGFALGYGKLILYKYYTARSLLCRGYFSTFSAHLLLPWTWVSVFQNNPEILQHPLYSNCWSAYSLLHPLPHQLRSLCCSRNIIFFSYWLNNIHNRTSICSYQYRYPKKILNSLYEA